MRPRDTEDNMSNDEIKSFYNEVTALCGGKVRFDGFYAVTADGETVHGDDLTNVSITRGAGALALSGVGLGGGLALAFNAEKSGGNVSMRLTARTKGGVKVKSLAAFTGTFESDEPVKVLRQDTGFSHTELKEVNAGDEGASIDYLGCYSGEHRLTAATAIPQHFDARYRYKATEGGVELTFVTGVPASFEGEAASERIDLGFGAPEDFFTSVAEDARAGNHEELPMGWTSWDYYYTSVDEDAVKRHADFIAADPVLSKKLKYVVIDDGWEQREGDWTENSRFRGGLKSLTKYLADRGLAAGIWTCPVRIYYLSATVQRRHDFLLRNEWGDPVSIVGGDGAYYIIDPTHPDGEKYLFETFSYLKECGFSYYKLDFVNFILESERFYDRHAGPYDALRKLFEITRRAVGADAHIMGCNMPMGVGGDAANSRRVGLDIHNNLGHAKKCFEIAIPQFALNGRVYRNDLDFMVVRGGETSVPGEATNVLNPKLGYYAAHPVNRFRWRDGKDFSYAEAKLWCTMVLAGGSSVFLSDCLPRLNERGLSLVRRAVTLADGVAARPEKMDEFSIPFVYRTPDRLYLINATSSPAELTVNTAMFGKNARFTDGFTDEKFVSTGDELKITLAPLAAHVLIKG